MHNKRSILFCFLLISFLSSCVSAPIYHESAYRELCELKVKSHNILLKSGTSYYSHIDEISSLKFDMTVAYEYAKNRPNNEEQIAQFDLMMNEDGALLFGVLKRWETKGSLPKRVRERSIKEIDNNFDHMLGLESGKLK